VSRAAEGFQSLGVGNGVRVGLYLPNCVHYVISFFAVLEAGGTVVNFSPLDAERVLKHKIEDSKTEIVVTLDLDTFYPQMERLLERALIKKLVIGSLDDHACERAQASSLRSTVDRIEIIEDERHVMFRRLIDHCRLPQPFQIGDPTTTIAVIQYTGGTTGLPKGAMLSHANLMASGRIQLDALSREPPFFEAASERMLAVIPLFHIYSLAVHLLLGLRLGAEVVLHSKFDVDAVMREIAARQITFFCGVPTMYGAMVNFPNADKMDLRSLKYCFSGGAPFPLEIRERFLRLTSCFIYDTWGMTEISAIGSLASPSSASKIGTCGKPAPGVEMKIIGDTPASPGSGVQGEIGVRGPNVMIGYLNNPDATLESFTTDGFFRTGDVGRIDEDGFLYIVDRSKDMILCNGFNVYPRIVEEAIYEHEAVAEVLVIGIPDIRRGQTPKAFVKLKPGAAPFGFEDLRTFLKPRLGKHEMIGALEIRDDLPKTPVGKLSKKDLYEEEARRRKTAQ
jgi:long-chain acyl-CoA synthetase